MFVEQVKLYNPDVIIFGGTFDLAGSYVMDNQINGEIVWSDDRQLSLTKYCHKDRLILAAAHPGIRHNVGFWVNSIIDALNDFSKKSSNHEFSGSNENHGRNSIQFVVKLKQ